MLPPELVVNGWTSMTVRIALSTGKARAFKLINTTVTEKNIIYFVTSSEHNSVEFRLAFIYSHKLRSNLEYFEAREGKKMAATLISPCMQIMKLRNFT